MNKVALFSSNKLQELFRETASKRRILPAAIEKDFWVCRILNYLFNESPYKQDLIFKGGTSLSKVYHIIHRFSEDIDLVLNWNLLGIDDGEAWLKRSKSKQDKFNKALNETACTFIRDDFGVTLVKEIENLGIPGFQVIGIDKHDVNISFPSVFEKSYIKPEIKLEIGPLAAWTPHGKYKIKSYTAEEYPSVFETCDFEVTTIELQRTFWEKVTILHKNAHRDPEKPFPLRYSRHYYDVYQILTSQYRSSVIGSLELLYLVARFKIKFYPTNWARYDTAKPGTLNLLPPFESLKHLKNDYMHMSEMIFGRMPEFDEIIETLRNFETEINSLTG